MSLGALHLRRILTGVVTTVGDSDSDKKDDTTEDSKDVYFADDDLDGFCIMEQEGISGVVIDSTFRTIGHMRCLPTI